MKPVCIRWGGRATSTRLTPPPSKSDAMRHLLLLHARDEGLPPDDDSLPDDIRTVRRGLLALQHGGDRVSINAGLGGGPFRFLLAAAALSPGRVILLDALPALRRRPHQPLVAALRSGLGSSGLVLDTSRWPWRIDTRSLSLPPVLETTVEATSSQYLTALLLACARPVARGHTQMVRIELLHELASAEYAFLTRRWMEEAGFVLESDTRIWQISGFERNEWKPAVPGDWSSAAYLLIWSWISGVPVMLPDSRHPDAAIIDTLRKAGLQIERTGRLTRCAGTLTSGLRGSASMTPDLLPTLAMIALTAPGESCFTHMDILRDKESDRLEFIRSTVVQAGGSTRLKGSTLWIRPGEGREGSISVECMHDHRRAMSGSLLAGLGWKSVRIDDATCVSKSFPGYWEQVQGAGGIVEAC